jgi:hypothetical protein
MMSARSFLLCIGLCSLILPSFGEPRSFDDLFQNLDGAKREQAFSPGGIISTSRNPGALQLLPPSLSALNIQGPVLERRPVFLVESLLVIPRPGVELVDIYNALGRVRDLKGRRYRSFTRGEEVPLFEDATRIQSTQRLTPIPDPAPLSHPPSSETIYIRLKDANFGNSFYRADIAVNPPGLLYRLTNFRSMNYLFIPVIRENKFIAQLYLEPLAEGVLIYSVAGADVSDFVSSRIDMPSAIQKRLEVILGWAVDGIR